MRIILDGRFYGLEHAGLGRYTINLVNELQKIDKENEYFILLRKAYFNTLKLTENWTKVLAEIPHYTFREQTAIPRLLKATRPDLVHFLHINIPVSYSGRFMVTVHDLTMHTQKKAATTRLLPLYYAKRLPYKLIVRKAVLGAQKIITPSEAVKDEVVHYYKVPTSKIASIYEGVEASFFLKGGEKLINKKYNLPNEYFIYAGSLYPHKNIFKAIDSIIKFNKGRAVKVPLVLVSSRNVFQERVRDYVQKRNAEKFIRILGFVSDPELRDFYKSSTGFIYPSLSEGFGLQGLEAMASGTLLLASDIPVFREIYKTYATYFNPQNIESISEALEEVLQLSSNERRKRIEEGQKLAKLYTWRKMALATLEVYKNVS